MKVKTPNKRVAIQLQVKRHVLGGFLGFYRSLFRGKGLEYDEIRKYVPGDDPKAFVWAKLAQLGEAYVKTFVEERDLTVLIALDTSSSVFWARPEKARLALETAALLIFSAGVSRDRVGLALFSGQVDRFIPPRRGMAHAGRLVEVLGTLDFSQRTTSLTNSFRGIGARRGPKRAVIFVISDFMSEEPDWEAALASLARYNDLIALQVVDKWELSPPPIGWVYAADSESGRVTLSKYDDRHVNEVRQKLEKNRLAFMHYTTHHSIGMVELKEGQDPAQTLRTFFAKRCRMLKRG